MYAVTHRLDPETYHALARAVFAEMLLAGYTAVGEFHYVHHAAGGSPLRRPERHGEGADQRGARGRHPDHAARHLLPGRRADRRRPRAPRRGAAALLRRHRRCVGGAGRARCRTTRPCASVRPCTRCAPCRATTWRWSATSRPATIGRCTCTCRSSPARTSPARASTAARRPSCSKRRGCSPRDDTGARNSPVRQRHRAPRGCPRHRLLLPDDRAGPRRRHRPGPSAARRRGAPRPGVRPACRHRPLRGGPRRRDARAAREPGARPLRGGRPARHGRAQRLPLAGLGRRRCDRERSRRRPRRRAARQPAHGRLRRRPACSTRRPPPTSPTSWSRASTWSARADTGRAMSAACSTTRSRRCGGDARGGSGTTASGTVLVTGIGELVTCAGRTGRPRGRPDDAGRRPARHRPRRRRRRGRRPGRLGRAVRRRHPRPTASSTSAGARWCPASSTATATSSTPATGPPSSRRGWRASPTTVAASASRWRPPGRRPTTSCEACCGPGSPRCARSARRRSRSRAATG